MDYKQYYLSQAGRGTSFFTGVPIQKGYGVGTYFRKFMRWIVPIVKEHAVPALKSAAHVVGNELLDSVGKVASDLKEGSNLSDSATKRLGESLENINKKAKSYMNGEPRARFLLGIHQRS